MTASQIDVFEDADFASRNVDKEIDRKFNEIIMQQISIDNQIMCQFAQITTHASEESKESLVERKARAQSHRRLGSDNMDVTLNASEDSDDEDSMKFS